MYHVCKTVRLQSDGTLFLEKITRISTILRQPQHGQFPFISLNKTHCVELGYYSLMGSGQRTLDTEEG